MLQTIEAIIDANGRVRLLEKIQIGKRRRALVTILEEEAALTEEKSIVGSMKMLEDDLAGGSQIIAETFHQSLEKSAENLTT